MVLCFVFCFVFKEIWLDWGERWNHCMEATVVWVSSTREERGQTFLRLQEGMPAKAQVKKWALV